MRIVIFSMGYLGTISGVCLAELRARLGERRDALDRTRSQ